MNIFTETEALCSSVRPVNASEETIKIGPLAIRFLLTGDDSNGAAADGPPDEAKMMDVFRRHGMTVAAPPAAK